MPKFFLPFARNATMAEGTYSEIRTNVARANPQWEILPDKIFAVQHMHNGKVMRSEVGQLDNGETVIAIFRTAGGPYLVCTENRGVSRGLAMLTDGDGSATLFDPD